MLESHFEIFRGTDTLYHFHLRNQYAEVLLTGYPYFFQPGCYVGIMNIRAHCQMHYIIRSDAPFAYSFRIHDGTHETIAHGAFYETDAEREQAIEQVLALAPLAPVMYLGSIMSLEMDTLS
ncbi:YegP family protein [Hymenobacter cavernae]|uniref:DUF1508 domain-containing protein n=1 Tax=Hymenobacter cavernae TaxID=2044852 RepID=A0ABQ1UIF8_9BACT|nr:YegP family protein [Hymenobacter cavernae]GGF18934.1 hypothetical protein GCM10011383_33050 [Hymenobacter cavernae]